MAGILEDDYAYLLAESARSSNDALVGDELYVIEKRKDDGKDLVEVCRIDLNSSSGKDGFTKASMKMYIPNAIYSYINVQGDYVLIQGAAGLALDAKTLKTLFDEASVKTDVWERGGYAFIHNGLYYRRRAVLQPVGGMDVVDMATYKVVDYLDCDIKNRTLPYKGIIYGERANGNFALYSIDEKKYCLEVECGQYGEEKGRGLRFSVDNNHLYLLCGEYVVVVDLEARTLAKEIHYALSPIFLAMVKRTSSETRASLISACDGVVALIDYGYNGWFGAIDTNSDDSFMWISSGDNVDIINTLGDLLYGMEDEYPTIYDKYTGELIWKSNISTVANDIHVGESWVVYSSLAGQIQCYKMLGEEYRSPAHPAA